jgi:membrane-bound lytic murein transglycosylase D
VLPQETRNYVPIIVAVTIMAKNPTQYGLEGVVPEQAVPTDQATIDYPVDLRLVAECLDTPESELQELNPSLLRMTTPKDQTFTLNLPAGSRAKYEEAISLIPPDMRTFWRYHRVGYGDSLASIARKYHTTTALVAEANNLPDDEVKAGTKLIIPIAPGKGGDAIAYSKKATHHKVRKGDTLGSIADDYEVPLDKLKKWNHLRGNTVAVGRSLVIYRPLGEGGSQVASSGAEAAATKSGKKGKTTQSAKSGSKSSSQSATLHMVKPGETLTGIAQSYNTTVANLKRNNANLTATLRAGEVLVIRK